MLTARHPLRRSTLGLLVVWCEILVWALVLAWPGRAPLPVLVLLSLLVLFFGFSTVGNLIAAPFNSQGMKHAWLTPAGEIGVQVFRD